MIIAGIALLISLGTAGSDAAPPLTIPPIRETYVARQVTRIDRFVCPEIAVSLSVEEGTEAISIVEFESTDGVARDHDLEGLSEGLRGLVRLRALYANCRGARTLELVFGGQLNAGGLEEDRRVLRVTPGRPPEWLPREP